MMLRLAMISSLPSLHDACLNMPSLIPAKHWRHCHLVAITSAGADQSPGGVPPRPISSRRSPGRVTSGPRMWTRRVISRGCVPDRPWATRRFDPRGLLNLILTDLNEPNTPKGPAQPATGQTTSAKGLLHPAVELSRPCEPKAAAPLGNDAANTNGFSPAAETSGSGMLRLNRAGAPCFTLLPIDSVYQVSPC